MNKISKKSLKSSKKGDAKLEKKIKTEFKKVKSNKVTEFNENSIESEIEDKLRQLRDNVQVEEKEIKESVEEIENMEICQNNDTNENDVGLAKFSVKSTIENKRVIIVKNINNTTNIEEILSIIKNKDDVRTHNSIKVRNRGVKTQMLTIEFKDAHRTNALVNKLNETVIDGNTLIAEYKYHVVDSNQCESKRKTDRFVIKNLSLTVTKEKIKELIPDFDVSNRNIQIFKKFGKNCCFIKFNSVNEAAEAFIILKDKIVDGLKLDLKYVSEKKEDNEQLSASKLHITNLPYTINRERLEKEFDMADTIKFPLTASGKSKGCCYLSFSSTEMASLAFEALQDKMIDDRKIRCEFADVNVVVEDEAVASKSVASQGKKRVRAKTLNQLQSVVTLFNLPANVTSEEIAAKFVGVKSVTIMKKGDVFKGIADVQFDDRKAAMVATRVPDFSINGREIRKELKSKNNVGKSQTKIKSEIEPMES